MAFRIELDRVAHEVEILALRPLRLRIDGVACVVTAADGGEEGRQRIGVDGKTWDFTRAQVGARQILRFEDRVIEATWIDPRDRSAAAGAGHDHVRAPMPGTVIRVHKTPGEPIARGEALLTIESMKLQMTLNAPRDGVLTSLARGVGETFDKDEIVAELAPLEEI